MHSAYLTASSTSSWLITRVSSVEDAMARCHTVFGCDESGATGEPVP